MSGTNYELLLESLRRIDRSNRLNSTPEFTAWASSVEGSAAWSESETRAAMRWYLVDQEGDAATTYAPASKEMIAAAMASLVESSYLTMEVLANDAALRSWRFALELAFSDMATMRRRVRKVHALARFGVVPPSYVPHEDPCIG